MQATLLRKIPMIPNQYKFLILIAVFFLVLLIGYSWDISSIKANTREVMQQEEQLINQYQQLLQLKAKLEYQVKYIPELNKQLDKWQHTLVAKKDLPDLLNDILNLANKNSLYISMFDPANTQNAGFLSKLNIQTILVGRYNQLAGFISELANNKHLIVIDKMVINDKVETDLLGNRLAENAKRQGLLTLQLGLLVYFESQEEGGHET